MSSENKEQDQKEVQTPYELKHLHEVYEIFQGVLDMQKRRTTSRPDSVSPDYVATSILVLASAIPFMTKIFAEGCICEMKMRPDVKNNEVLLSQAVETEAKLNDLAVEVSEFFLSQINLIQDLTLPGKSHGEGENKDLSLKSSV